MENKVSIWVGNFSSEDEFSEYISFIYPEDEQDFDEENYDYDQDPESAFSKDFQTGYYDDSFQDAYCSGECMDLKTLVSPISYAESFLDKLPSGVEGINTVVALYDFEYDGKVKENQNLRFLGVFDYDKNC